MTTATLIQRQAAEIIVNRLRDRKLERVKTPLEERTDKIFFWILNNIARDIEYPFKMEYKKVFILVKTFSKTFYLMVEGNYKNYVRIDVSTIKGARDMIRRVSEMFNSVDNWHSEFSQYSRREEEGSYGVLKVSVKAD